MSDEEKRGRAAIQRMLDMIGDGDVTDHDIARVLVDAELDIRAALAAQQLRGDWRPIDSAPKDGEFLVWQDGEVYHARIVDGRMQWRTHQRWQSTTDLIKHVEHDGQTVEAKIRTHEGPETFDHNWTLWTRGFDFKPTHWAPFAPPALPPEEG